MIHMASLIHLAFLLLSLSITVADSATYETRSMAGNPMLKLYDIPSDDPVIL